MLAGEVLGVHVHEAPLGEAGFPPLRVAYPQSPQIETVAQIERQPILKDFDATQVEPFSLVYSEGQWQPVGEVDEVLILDGTAIDQRCEPVVATGNIRAGIIQVISACLGGGSAGHEVPVADGEQGFATPLQGRVETLMGKQPEVRLSQRRRMAGLGPWSRDERVEPMYIQLGREP